jgi:hypothetical protein
MVLCKGGGSRCPMKVWWENQGLLLLLQQQQHTSQLL